MNNLMGDLEVIDTKDSKDFLKDKNKKKTLLNWINNNDFEKFELFMAWLKIMKKAKKMYINYKDVTTTFHESLMHLAIFHYVRDKNARYMKLLWDINFPLYEEDQNWDIPVFTLSLCSTDDEFINGLQILIKDGLDIN